MSVNHPRIKVSNSLNERYRPKRKKFIYRPKMSNLIVTRRVLCFWETKEYQIGGRFKRVLLGAR